MMQDRRRNACVVRGREDACSPPQAGPAPVGQRTDLAYGRVRLAGASAPAVAVDPDRASESAMPIHPAQGTGNE